MNQYSFLEKAVFSVKDIRQYFSSDAEMRYTLRKLLADERITRVRQGLYATLDPAFHIVIATQFEIATALFDGAYCAYHTAMDYYGMASQMSFEVCVVASKSCQDLNLQIDEDTRYKVVVNPYSEGIITIMRHDAPVRITDRERTVVDCIDRYHVAGGIEEVANGLRTLSYCNEEKLLKYLYGYNKRVLFKKAGFLFSRIKPWFLTQHFYDECKAHSTTHTDDIRINSIAPYTHDKEWNILATDEFLS